MGPNVLHETTVANLCRDVKISACQKHVKIVKNLTLFTSLFTFLIELVQTSNQNLLWINSLL